MWRIAGDGISHFSNCQEARSAPNSCEAFAPILAFRPREARHEYWVIGGDNMAVGQPIHAPHPGI